MDDEQKDGEQAKDGEKAAETEGKVIRGDSGLQPLSSLDQHNPNGVGPASAPPPQSQSGVPLAEDRAAGVEPGHIARP